MQLTEQQRAELERRRFRPVPISDDGVVIVDYVGQRQWYIGPGDGELAYRRAMELAAVLGITPPGYRLVQEEVAEKAVPLIEELLQHMARSRVSLNDVEADLSKAERKHIWTALASALQGKEREKR